MDDNITKEQADECLKIVQKWIDKKLGPGWTAKLHEPGFHCNGWAIALEGGPEDWPWYINNDESVSWPSGVFTEPGASWYLGLYLAWPFHVKH